MPGVTAVAERHSTWRNGSLVLVARMDADVWDERYRSRIEARREAPVACASCCFSRKGAVALGPTRRVVWAAVGV